MTGPGGGSIAFGGTFGGPTPAPSPAFGALPPAAEAAAVVAAAAASQLERLQLGQGEQPRATARRAAGAAGGPAAAAAAGQERSQDGGELEGMGDAEAAMRAAGELADDLMGGGQAGTAGFMS